MPFFRTALGPSWSPEKLPLRSPWGREGPQEGTFKASPAVSEPSLHPPKGRRRSAAGFVLTPNCGGDV